MAGLGLGCPGALADGDPASDVLLAQNVFYPYNPPVSAALEQTLNGLTAAAAKAHFHIRLAIIASPYDLGVVPEMLGHPQTYASFLDRELRLFLGPHPALLVVMSNGYGSSQLTGAVKTAAAGLGRPAGKSTDDLVKAAIAAVPKLAAAAGHPISAAAGDGGGGTGSGGSPLTIVIVAVVAIALAGGILVARRRLATGRRAA